MAELKAAKLRKAPYFLIPLLDSTIFRNYTASMNIVAEHINKESYAELLWLDNCAGRHDYNLRKEPNGNKQVLVSVNYSGCAERAVEEAIAERSLLPVYLYLMNPLFRARAKDSALQSYIAECEFIVDGKEMAEVEWLKQVAKLKVRKRKLGKAQENELGRIVEEIRERKGMALEEADKPYGLLRKIREEHAEELGMSSEENKQMQTDDDMFRKAIVERLKRISLLNIYLLLKLVKIALKKF
ncbi:MAG: hypothetical protein QW035_03670 [Candidatus Anstonellales archaeon]